MLFNSYIFVLAFLPLTWAGFLLIGKRGHHRVATAWLVGASLFFYGWWNPAYLGLILGSMLFNYALGTQLGSRGLGPGQRRTLLAVGVGANLALLGYYKYANFFLDNLNRLFDSDLTVAPVLLPLAISFFTFQQIAFLVDAYRGEMREYNFLHYCLFVTFFPQLIAGPIVHHREVMPQFARDATYRYQPDKVALGISLFCLGLFKKVVLADGLAPHVQEVFSAAAEGQLLLFAEAWYGALAYSFQLYFDFSGYADMAIGLGLLFGIQLPVNFTSPYKATSVIDFWRRWHMTLSRFLRDYLYIPLGGSRHGRPRRYLNLLLTMVLGGLWHGAGWTFVLWGGLHGLYLCLNHAWRSVVPALPEHRLLWPLRRALPWLLTFAAVVFAWVVFRADDLATASRLWHSMLGLQGLVGAEGGWFDHHLFHKPAAVSRWLVGSLLIVLLLPNALQLTAQQPYPGRLSFRPNLPWLALVLTLAFSALIKMNDVSEFLYFRF